MTDPDHPEEAYHDALDDCSRENAVLNTIIDKRDQTIEALTLQAELLLLKNREIAALEKEADLARADATGMLAKYSACRTELASLTAQLTTLREALEQAEHLLQHAKDALVVLPAYLKSAPEEQDAANLPNILEIFNVAKDEILQRMGNDPDAVARRYHGIVHPHLGSHALHTEEEK